MFIPSQVFPFEIYTIFDVVSTKIHPGQSTAVYDLLFKLNVVKPVDQVGFPVKTWNVIPTGTPSLK